MSGAPGFCSHCGRKVVWFFVNGGWQMCDPQGSHLHAATCEKRSEWVHPDMEERRG